MKKLISLTMVAMMLIAMLAGCGSSNAPETTAAPDAAPDAAPAAKEFTVGVCQLMVHDSLDQATQGFIDALTEAVEATGNTVKVDTQVAGEAGLCTTVINTFTAKQVDLIMANATPALLAAANATTTIPVLGTSVTDYADTFAGNVPANVYLNGMTYILGTKQSFRNADDPIAMEFLETVCDIPALPEYQKLKQYRHHYGTTRYQHCLNVAWYTFLWCRNAGLNYRSAARGAMLHDFYLFYCIRRGYSPRKVLRLAETVFAGEFDRKVLLYWLKNFYRRFFIQQFKRSCLPDGPKVGSVSLSPRGDWHMPSDASSALWMAELETLE